MRSSPKNSTRARGAYAIFFALSTPLITACGRADQLAQADTVPSIAEAQPSAETSAEISGPLDPAFARRLQQVANEYRSYTLVDRHGHWSPEQCWWAPTPQFSNASPHAPHSQKLYFLYIKDPLGYDEPEATQPVGQAIVKQSWSPKEVPTHEIVDADGGRIDQRAIPYASRDGKLYRGDHQTGLFVMLKLDSDTPGTDEGWIYGTVTPDGKGVMSAGRVENCMKCHQQAKGDRVFGIERDASPANSVDD